MNGGEIEYIYTWGYIDLGIYIYTWGYIDLGGGGKEKKVAKKRNKKPPGFSLPWVTKNIWGKKKAGLNPPTRSRIFGEIFLSMNKLLNWYFLWASFHNLLTIRLVHQEVQVSREKVDFRYFLRVEVLCHAMPSMSAVLHEDTHQWEVH